MISLCSVTLDCLERYFEPIFLESVTKKTKFISEVLLAKVGAEPSYYEEWQVGSIKFIKFGCNTYHQEHGI